mgnify:CR=1 FL=1
MLFKRLVREQAEQVFVVAQNNTGSGTALVKDQPVCMDTGTAADGVKVVTPTTAAFWCFSGVVDAAIADQDFGLVQTYGYRSSSQVFMTGTTVAAGQPLIPVNAVSYLQSTASSYTFASNTTVSVTQFPYFAALVSSAASSSASGTQSIPIFLRCL